MNKLFYRYLYEIDPRFENARYTPSFILPKKSKLLGSVVKMEDELIPESKYWDFGGHIADYRYGQLSVEDASLALLGWTLDEVRASAESISQSMALKFLTNAEMAADIRKFADLKEVEPSLFLVAEAVTDGPFGPSEAKFIDCR